MERKGVVRSVCGGEVWLGVCVCVRLERLRVSNTLTVEEERLGVCSAEEKLGVCVAD